MERTLILGVGNPLMADEGIGIEAVRVLNERFKFPENIELVDGGTKGLELLRFFDDVKNLIIIDAIFVSGKSAGEIVLIEKDRVKYYLKSKMSVHDIGLEDLFSVLEFTGKMPENVLIIGMVPEKIEFSYGLSDTVKGKMEELIKEVLKQINRLEAKENVDECSPNTL